MAQQVIFDAQAVAAQLDQFKGSDVKTNIRIKNLQDSIRQLHINKLTLNDDGSSEIESVS